jgi:asparagine synthase (glutamine-hydrolysing)
MCGILFADQREGQGIDRATFAALLECQRWRGPDSSHVVPVGRFLLGHNRLSIIDPIARSDQPMFSACGRFAIVFNGEIYNHRALREGIPLEFRTQSDTETILQGFIHFGEPIFEKLEGMFALIILDVERGTWVAARDRFGIKPFFYHSSRQLFFAASEGAVVARAIEAPPSAESVEEWRMLRRPTPGYSYFEGVSELLPGQLLRSDGSSRLFGVKTASSDAYSSERFAELLQRSIAAHQLSDVGNVALLSGGLDSAVVVALSEVGKTYTVGLPGNNEFEGACETAQVLNRELVQTVVANEEIFETWRVLTRLRGEPLSVPNEALIFKVCHSMQPNEKVVLTGEGADELMFGYDRIYRWALASKWAGIEDFLRMYGYSDSTPPTERFQAFVEHLREGKSLIEFVEDFFYEFHLTGLLRRMDFASMAASKEARVPFVDVGLVNYMYRRQPDCKLTPEFSKLPIRTLALNLGLSGALNRKKIGFSASSDTKVSKYVEYAVFQEVVLGELGW